MNIVYKWNLNKRKYDKVELPESWHLPIYSNDMSETINCVNCGSPLEYGDGYTSMRYHTKAGFGYYECEKCYKEYLPLAIEAKTKNPNN